MKFQVKVEGPQDVKRILGEIAPREAFNLMRATVHGMATHIAKDAKELAPEGYTGALVENIKSKRENPKGMPGRVAASVIVGRRAFYWRFLEYGTPEIAPVAYFAAAIEKFRSQMDTLYLEIFKKKLIAALKRARKRNGG